MKDLLIVRASDGSNKEHNFHSNGRQYNDVFKLLRYYYSGGDRTTANIWYLAILLYICHLSINKLIYELNVRSLEYHSVINHTFLHGYFFKVTNESSQSQG